MQHTLLEASHHAQDFKQMLKLSGFFAICSAKASLNGHFTGSDISHLSFLRQVLHEVNGSNLFIKTLLKIYDLWSLLYVTLSFLCKLIRYLSCSFR